MRYKMGKAQILAENPGNITGSTRAQEVANSPIKIKKFLQKERYNKKNVMPFLVDTSMVHYINLLSWD